MSVPIASRLLFVSARMRRIQWFPDLACRCGAGRRGVLVVDDDVDVAVIVDVAERRAAADVLGVEVGPRVAGRQLEPLLPSTLRNRSGGSS